MKLGINLVPLFPGKIGGAEQYIRNIINIMQKEESLDIYLFVNEYAYGTFEETENLHKYVIELEKPHTPQLQQYIDSLSLDVWFCPLFHLIPEDCSIPSAVMIFDIQQEYYPENFSKYELQERRKQTSNTLKKANKILTISEFSKKTIIEKYNISPEKIAVTYLDADHCFNNPFDDLLNKKVKTNLPEKYIFYPANMWPHKNHLALLEAYQILKNRYGFDADLVFTGNQDKETDKIKAFIESNDLRNQVRYLGYIPQNEMPYIFHNAQLLVFPSKFEGFGIPLVEAMKSNLPIVCANSTCIPEIVGDAAVLFDENDPENIAETILRVYQDDNLKNKLLTYSEQRKNLFSWETCATTTIDILQSLYVPVEPKAMFLETRYPLVSIITPSYNQGEFIKATIDSVLNQDYPNIEYIVMDGGSTDETVEILKSYGDKIIWVSEKDGGQADAVNKGIAKAKGDIIGWLNSDDTYCEGAISRIVDYFYSHPKIDMVYGEGYYIDKSGKITDRYPTAMFNYEELAHTCYICQPTAFFTTDIVKKVGLLDKDLHLCMDYELWMKIGRVGKVAYISDYLATSRMYEENKTLSRRTEVYKEVCKTVKKYYGYVPRSWCQGYAYYLTDGKNNKLYKLVLLALFLKYNITNFKYMKLCVKKYLKKKIKPESISEKFTGRYADGWIGKEYGIDLLATQEKRKLCIQGTHLLPFSATLAIDVIVDGVVVDSIELNEYGDFVYNIPTEYTEGMHKVLLKANGVYNPKKESASQDDRDLSIILTNISFV